MHTDLARIDADLDRDRPDQFDTARGALIIGPALGLMVAATIALTAAAAHTGNPALAALIAAPVTAAALIAAPRHHHDPTDD